VARVETDPGIPGKKLLPQLGIGCLVFGALMGFGTYGIARLWTPYLAKKNAEYLKTHHAPNLPKAPPQDPHPYPQ